MVCLVAENYFEESKSWVEDGRVAVPIDMTGRISRAMLSLYATTKKVQFGSSTTS